MLHLQVTKTTMELLPLVCVSLLTWSGTTFADENGVSVAVKEGGAAILPCSLSTKENIEKMVFDWKKDGQKEVFFYDAGSHYNKGRSGQDEQFKGRVFHFENDLKYGNASIKVQNTKMADNGTYTCNFPGKQMSYITLFVGAAPKPYITTLNETKDGVLLQCEVQGAFPKPEVEWKDSDGNILPAEKTQVSENDGRYNIILQTTVNKAGRFRCVATQKEIYHQIYAETYVPIRGAATKPYVTSLDVTKHWALLQCEVRGASPKPKLRWQDSDGNILHAKEPKVTERGDVILQTTVTKTDNYRCVATQEEIKHQIYAETHVYIHEPNVIKVIVEEGSDAILPCSPSSKENIVSQHFDWKKDGQKEVFRYDAGPHSNDGRSGQDKQFIGRVSHFEDELKSGNASIIIRHTMVADSGNYTCDFPLLQPRQIFHIKLHVGGTLKDRTAENIPGAAREPYVTSLDVTKNSALLQCKVRGVFPKPKLHWQDSDGNILHAEEPKVTERGGRYDVILNINVTKTNNYRCVATQEEINHQIYAETHVFISETDVINMTVDEGSDVILNCSLSSKENIVSQLFDWKKDGQKQVFVYNGGIKTTSEHFKERVLPFEDELKSGNASIIIRNTKVADSGVYTCDFPQLQPRQISHIKLLVVGDLKDRTAENIPGTARKPSVTILKETKDGMLLQCEVQGASPKPEVEWKDSDGIKLPAEKTHDSGSDGRYDITLQTTVNKSGYFRCVATQKEISHTIYSETYVPIKGAAPEPYITTLKETKDGVPLRCVVRGAFPKPEVEWKDSDGIKLPAEKTQDSESNGLYNIILQTTVNKAGSFRCEATQKEISHTTYSETYVPIRGAAPEPYVTSLHQTVNWALLQCKVRGAFPKPKLHWQDSDGNILHAEEPKVSERGGRYDVILQTTVNKTDNYRCVATQEEISHQTYAETHVYISEPDVIKVEEGSDVILPCSPISKESIEFGFFDWKKDDQKEVFVYDSGIHTNNGRTGQDKQFIGRVSHFKDELKSGNASIIIRHTTVADSGNYTCEFPQLQPRQIFHIKLHVGAAPKPSITSLNQTQYWALLQCEVRAAFPKPKLHWQDSDGNILHAEEPKVSERGGRYDVILQINVTKTDNYRCVATQEEIKHQIYAETHVFIHDTTAENKPGSSDGWIVGAFFIGVGGGVPSVFGVKHIISRIRNKDRSAAV
ncbi:hemicentin-1-like [Thunnus thynnus]|uniref:hemicentin-1-like n=1 Tax=Thunnus thynnus TaxID=8237 RepID=UPI003529990F